MSDEPTPMKCACPVCGAQAVGHAVTSDSMSSVSQVTWCECGHVAVIDPAGTGNEQATLVHSFFGTDHKAHERGE